MSEIITREQQTIPIGW